MRTTWFRPSQVATETARCVFGLEAPFTVADLKKAYRRRSLEVHPDVAEDKAVAEEAFKELVAAYEFLSNLQGSPGLFCPEKDGPVNVSFAVTGDGTPLSELGLGLGPTTNGRDCEVCDHKGYTIHHGRHFVVCEACDEFGRMREEFPCHSCKQTGKFTLRSGRVVDCRFCLGTGKVKGNRYRVCSKCHGSKTLWVEDDKPYYSKCSHCDGTGEIKIFNPVLLKGALTF